MRRRVRVALRSHTMHLASIPLSGASLTSRCSMATKANAALRSRSAKRRDWLAWFLSGSCRTIESPTGGRSVEGGTAFLECFELLLDHGLQQIRKQRLGFAEAGGKNGGNRFWLLDDLGAIHLGVAETLSHTAGDADQLKELTC